ncbi:unnamed protein product [Closterium sp. NIES-64]|nr:unnamed protein product [Closterium sp. NIES-64]
MSAGECRRVQGEPAAVGDRTPYTSPCSDSLAFEVAVKEGVLTAVVDRAAVLLHFDSLAFEVAVKEGVPTAVVDRAAVLLEHLQQQEAQLRHAHDILALQQQQQQKQREEERTGKRLLMPWDAAQASVGGGGSGNGAAAAAPSSALSHGVGGSVGSGMDGIRGDGAGGGQHEAALNGGGWTSMEESGVLSGGESDIEGTWGEEEEEEEDEEELDGRILRPKARKRGGGVSSGMRPTGAGSAGSGGIGGSRTASNGAMGACGSAGGGGGGVGARAAVAPYLALKDAVWMFEAVTAEAMTMLDWNRASMEQATLQRIEGGSRQDHEITAEKEEGVQRPAQGPMGLLRAAGEAVGGVGVAGAVGLERGAGRGGGEGLSREGGASGGGDGEADAVCIGG